MQDDILYDDDFDVIDEGEEWAEGESDQANAELLLLINKGELREFPFCGFGIEKRLKQVADRKIFVRDLKVELERDGYKNPTITATENLHDLKVEI
jgi:hypothetical protein